MGRELTRLTPLLRVESASHKASFVLPRGLTTPTPVTATRRCLELIAIPSIYADRRETVWQSRALRGTILVGNQFHC